MLFGEDWVDPMDRKKQAKHVHPLTKEELAKAAASNEESLRKLAVCCKWFIPSLAIIAIIVSLVTIVFTSGTAVGQGIPRAAVIVLEGFKGTAFEALMTGNKLPNIAYIAAQGTRSYCTSIADSRCGRTQSGAMLGPQYTWTSGPGLASILSGVDANKHQVTNDSFNAYSQYWNSSQAYPSFLTLARKNGLNVQVLGASHLITSMPGPSSSCTLFGIADFECGVNAAGTCMATTSCNMDGRYATLPNNDFAGSEETALDNSIATLLQNYGSDIIVIHANKLARLAEDPNYPNTFYSETSSEYAAEAYVLDQVIGQLSAWITQRVLDLKENWIVLLTSDHGGLGKTSGTNTDDDEVIPFVLATMTANGNLVLNPLQLPTTQMDVAPTLLSWFGIVPPATMDGRVQGICSNGRFPADCVAATPL